MRIQEFAARICDTETATQQEAAKKKQIKDI